MICVWLICLFSACSGTAETDKKDTTLVTKPSIALPENLNFAEHIAPLVYKNCSPCPRPDGMAPFSLLTWNDLKRKAKTIRLGVPARVMPPWPADPHYSSFVGELPLTETEIALLCAWIDKGCVKGDSTKIPAAPVFPKGSMLAPSCACAETATSNRHTPIISFMLRTA